MPRLLPFAALTIVTTSLGACAHLATAPKNPYASEATRSAAIQRAQVWSATDVPSMDMKAGPQGATSFPPDATVNCNYLDKKLSGKTPKFACLIPPDEELKVKYGKRNGEVYAEVAAARLFWALGFGAEHMYPVHVVCAGCPPAVARDTDAASIEWKMAGTDLETGRIKGWAWSELDSVDPAQGGAPRAERDALKLLATLIQHTDSKPEQQRLICLPEHEHRSTGAGAETKAETKAEAKAEKKEQRQERKEQHQEETGKSCADPFMMVHDLGQTFGHANYFNRSSVSSVNLNEWESAPVWQDAPQCVAYLPKSKTGTLDNPHISEEGRAFLAKLLTQLTDAQLHDLFAASRFPERWDAQDQSHAATVDQWVDAFKKKRDAVVNAHCGATLAAAR